MTVTRGMRFLLLRPDTDRQPPMLAELYRLLAMAAAILGSEPPEGGGGGEPPGGGTGQQIMTRWGPAPANVSAAIMRYFPEQEWRNAAEISYLESPKNGEHWRPDAVRDTRAAAGGRCNVPIGRLPSGDNIVSEWSIGLFQINACAHGGDFEAWSSIDRNVRKAGELWRASGWRPWFISARTLGIL